MSPLICADYISAMTSKLGDSYSTFVRPRDPSLGILLFGKGSADMIYLPALQSLFSPRAINPFQIALERVYFSEGRVLV